MIPKDADYLIRGYSNALHRVLLETWHKGQASRDIEIAAWKARMRRGEVAYIEVVDLHQPFDAPTVIYSAGRSSIISTKRRSIAIDIASPASRNAP